MERLAMESIEDKKITYARRLVDLIRKADKTEQDNLEIRRLREKLGLIDPKEAPPIVNIRRVKQIGHAGYKNG